MNPKISDFGMAKIFGADETRCNTRRIAGTFGYMAPEYVIHGQFSVKLDVFSFGVLLLEIVSSQKNAYESDRGGDILSYIWKAWNDGIVLEVIDSTISAHCSRSEAVRCIHIGLLCARRCNFETHYVFSCSDAHQSFFHFACTFKTCIFH